MMKLSLTLGAAALAFCALAGGAQAGGDLDDGYGNGHGSGYGYRRESLSRLCYKHPEDPRCDTDAHRYVPKKKYYGEGGGACRASVRAAGKRNLIPAFARNSAIFSWKREVRGVHGVEFANWGRARGVSVVCGPAGGALTGCVATATPCRS